MKTEALHYENVGGLKRNLGTGLKNENGFSIQKESLILLPLAFLIGRVSFLDGLMPFGIALFATGISIKVSRLLLGAAILLGMITTGAAEQLYIVFMAMVLYSAINLLFKKEGKRPALKYSVCAMVSVLLPSMIITWFQGLMVYDILKLVFCGLIVFTVTYLLYNGLPAVLNKTPSHIFSNEEIISAGILLVLALAGIGDMGIAGISAKNILSIALITAFSFKNGPGVGSSLGVLVGVVSNLSSPYAPYMVATYGLAGLLAGLFRNIGKMGSVLGFTLGACLMALYNKSWPGYIQLPDVALALLLFIIIPKSLIDKTVGVFDRNVDTCPDKRSYSLRIKEITVERLNKFSHALSELAKTFNEISETKVAANKQDISILFDRVADKVCKDCSLCLHCWDRNFYSTYQVLFKIVEKVESKGRVSEEDIPGHFLSRCSRINEFIKALNNTYELFKVNMVWKSKIGESRGMVSQQLQGLSKVITNLANEVNLDIHFKTDMEDMLIMELNRKGIKVNEVIVFQNKWEKFEVSIFHKGCGGKRECLSSIEQIVSDVTGRKMIKEGESCSKRYDSEYCSIKFVEREAYRVTTGVAKLNKNLEKVSGDCYTFMNTGDGKYVVALSDGMGSGKKAATQSRATINLLEQFMESGFDKDTAIKLINSILVLKSDDDSFATIDMSVVDLYDGQVEFVKIGAVPTFIKSGERIDEIRTVSLPAGILGNIELELQHKNLEDGDFIIMMSDGVLDCFKNEDNNKEFNKLLSDIKSRNPQHIADKIMDEAYKLIDSSPKDDMLVLVAKVWKSAA